MPDAALVATNGLVDVVVDATGKPAVGAEIGLSAMEHGKHLVMMNVEADVTIGAYLKSEAERLGAEFLGEIPITLDIRATSDEGTPLTATMPESDEARIYRAIAGRVWEKCEAVNARRAAAAPRIVVE